MIGDLNVVIDELLGFIAEAIRGDLSEARIAEIRGRYTRYHEYSNACVSSFQRDFPEETFAKLTVIYRLCGILQDLLARLEPQ